MIVGVDNYVRIQSLEKKEGIHWVAQALLTRLPKKAPGEYGFVLYERGSLAQPLVQDCIGIDCLPKVNIYGGFYSFWLNISLPLYVAAVGRKPDLFWSPYGALPAHLPCPSVVFIHDLAYLFYPEYFTKKALLFLRYHVRRAARQATAIVVPSETTRSDIISHYGVVREKIFVIPWGKDDIFRPQDESRIRSVEERLAIRRPYVLFLGTLQPRKNLGRLLQAFLALKKEMDLPHKLVLVGKRGWLYGDLAELAIQPGMSAHVVFRDYVPREDVPALFGGSDLFILPSLYEGFGLPALEAMACGAPVAVSDTSSLPEVVGDAGVLFNPEDVNDIKEAVKKVLMSPTLQQELRKKSLLRAQKFDWDSCCQRLLEVFAGVC